MATAFLPGGRKYHARMKRGSLPADDPDYPLYSVTQVAEMLGVTPAALRRWEREGLISPRRTDGGQRRYSRREIGQLQRVVRLAEEGFATAAIGRLLELQDRIRDLEDRLAATHRPDRPDPADASAPDDPHLGHPRP
jgi:MerR family transcriptional regulator, heat shock protein HspR